MTERRVIVIGGGHNGLVCAANLAKAGFDVTVLEAAGQVGGAAVTREFARGFRVSACAHLLYQLDEGIAGELALQKHGLALAAGNLDTVALDAGGRHLVISGERITCEGVSREDHNAMARYRRRMLRFAGVIAGLHGRVPPRLASGKRADAWSLALLAWGIRRLGRKDMREFLRIAGINIYDVLEEEFEDRLLKGALCLDGVLGTHLGPRSNNSVFTTLHRMSGSVGGIAGAMAIPRGGMGAVSDALAAAAKSHGASLRTGAGVRRIIVGEGRAKGVELANGEVLAADIIVSSADPRTTLLDLLGARHLDAVMASKIAHVRNRGNAAKLHLALDGLPEFPGLDGDLRGQRLVIAPDMDYVERAFNHAKYGEHSAEPVMEITLPSLHDDALAPAGRHVLSAVVQYAPYGLKAGWSSAKSAFAERALETLARYAPSIREQIVASELLTPADIEAEFRIAGGHWHHAELALDQFLMLRPVAGAAQYATPVEGLYLCGAGCHPGGGVMGHAGRNAANVIVQEHA